MLSKQTDFTLLGILQKVLGCPNDNTGNQFSFSSLIVASIY